MTRKDKLLQYIDSLLPDEVLITWEYQFLDGFKVDDRRSVHTFNCDSTTTRDIISVNFDAQLFGSYEVDAEGNPIDGIQMLIDKWDKGAREYPEPEDNQEGGN